MMSKQTWYGCSCLSGCQETPRKVGDFYFIFYFLLILTPSIFFPREMNFYYYIVLYYIVIKIVHVTILIELNIFLLFY